MRRIRLLNQFKLIWFHIRSKNSETDTFAEPIQANMVPPVMMKSQNSNVWYTIGGFITHMEKKLHGCEIVDWSLITANACPTE